MPVFCCMDIWSTVVLPEEKSTPFWKLVLKQFDELLVKSLIVAAVVSFILALVNGKTGLMAFLEPSVILMILAVYSAVGVIPETNAEKALEELGAYQAELKPKLTKITPQHSSCSSGTQHSVSDDRHFPRHQSSASWFHHPHHPQTPSLHQSSSPPDHHH